MHYICHTETNRMHNTEYLSERSEALQIAERLTAILTQQHAQAEAQVAAAEAEPPTRPNMDARVWANNTRVGLSHQLNAARSMLNELRRIYEGE